MSDQSIFAYSRLSPRFNIQNDQTLKEAFWFYFVRSTFENENLPGGGRESPFLRAEIFLTAQGDAVGLGLECA